MTTRYAVVAEAFLPLALRQVIAHPDQPDAALVREHVLKNYYTASEQVRQELRLVVGEAAGGSAEWEKVLAGMNAEDARRERIREQHEQKWPGWVDLGHPSMDELHHVRTFEGTAREYMEFIAAIWRNGAGATIEETTDQFGQQVHRVTLVTGGWSGCESIISAMHQSLVTMNLCEWKAGGYWVFQFLDRDWNEKRSWAYPAEHSYRKIKLHERFRDCVAYLEEKLAEASA